MKKLVSVLLPGVISLSLIGCASIPSAEEMSQLNGEQVSAAITGNTWVTNHDWGRWTEYHREDMTGNGKASGSWGQEVVTSEYTISDKGEICSVYAGEPDWATIDDEYCGVVYTDETGKYFAKTTKNTSKPERVGQVKKLEIKPGDHYGLSE